MIVDLSSFVGAWPSHPVNGRADQVWPLLRSFGVDRIFASSLEAAWCRNPHSYNRDLYRLAGETDDVWPVPVLDPTVATWPAELDRAAGEDRARLVRLLPTYSSYDLADVDDFLAAVAQSGLGVIVQTCMEDPRRQHPLAVVPNLPAAKVAEAADRHPELVVVIGGAKAGEIRGLRDPLLRSPNLYADVSQADGMDTVRVLVEDGLGEKLMFGSHAPLFIPHAALARVVTDVTDDTAEAILGGNAVRALGLDA